MDALPEYAEAVPGLRDPRAERHPTEHVTTLRDKSNHPWISLILKSHAASRNSAPNYTEGQPVEGRVVVDLIKPQSIESIAVTVSKVP